MQVCVFVSQKPAARPYPDGLNSKISIHEYTEERRPSAFGTCRKQEYRITLRCNTAGNFKLRALARAAGIPRTEVLRQLILNGSVRERLRSEHLEWLAQLKRLARNLNQLTRLAHAQGFAAVAVRHATLQAELVRMIEALRRDR